MTQTLKANKGTPPIFEQQLTQQNAYAVLRLIDIEYSMAQCLLSWARHSNAGIS